MVLEWAFKIWSRLGGMIIHLPQQNVRMRALSSTKAKRYKALMSKENLYPSLAHFISIKGLKTFLEICKKDDCVFQKYNQ